MLHTTESVSIRYVSADGLQKLTHALIQETPKNENAQKLN